MTNFFARQEQARRRTGLLMLYFTAAVIATILMVYLVILLVLTGTSKRAAVPLWNPQVFLWSTAGTLVVLLGGSAFRLMEMAGGGAAVARSLGGRLISPQTRDPLERRLINVVEEMSLASGAPVPLLYVMDDEEGINAFAAGYSPNDAAIGVTRGCLKWLTRDELQGVIAHEYSHIFNGDMRLNIRLIALIAGIMGLTTIGYILLHTRGRDKSAGQVALIGLALLIIGWLGAFFGRLIQAAISRQREFLADASAVQYTRLPEGLASALKKIGGLAKGSRLENPRAGEAAHLFFCNGVSASLTGLLATHPPLVERIRALEPNFDGNFATPKMPAQSDAPPAPPMAAAKSRRSGLPPVIPVPAAGMMQLAGETTPEHLAQAGEIQVNLPGPVAAALHDPFGACTLVLALLLDRDGPVQARQLQAIARQFGQRLAEETRRLAPAAKSLSGDLRLPLVDLAAPALRDLSPAQYQSFSACLQEVIQSDQKVDLFEYALQKVLRRHLDPHFLGARPARVEYYSIKGLADEAGLLLSALAHIGQREPAAVQQAFGAGVDKLVSVGVHIPFFSWDQCNAESLDRALDKSNAALPAIRARLIEAMVLVIATDGVVQPAEAELLRAFAAALDCPIPPVVTGTLRE